MTDKKILEVFYNDFINESKMGKINCYFNMNIAFNFSINNEIVSKFENDSYDGVLIPTLKVTNQEMFNSLLVEYVKKARDFYDESNFSFLNDLDNLNIDNVLEVKERYLIKYIIASLFANISLNDFENPNKFLESRIAMFDNKILKDDEEICLGYIDSIGANLYVKEEKCHIKAETPYQIKSYLQFDDDYVLRLPEIYCGCNGDKYELYGIQRKTQGDENEKTYLKQIRKGYIAKLNGAPEHYFLAVMLFLSLCKDKEIEIIPFLIERWNAKKVAMFYRARINQNISLDAMEQEQEKIQSNITDIFIRYFTKIEDVSSGIEFVSDPFGSDTSLHIKINDDLESRCVAFNELVELSNRYKTNGKAR